VHSACACALRIHVARVARLRRIGALKHRLCALAAAALCLTAANSSAERLPLRSYTSADGLSHDRVKRIATDRDGFVWFCTLEGLSRFDGRRFVNFGVADGLPVPSTNDILETPRGLWVASNGGGVAFLEPDAVAPRFRVIATGKDASARVNALARDRLGALWAGTDGGLFRLAEGTAWQAGAAFRSVPLGIPGRDDASVAVMALLATAEGVLAGTSHGLVFVSFDGIARPVALGGKGPSSILALGTARDGRILVGRGGGQGLDVLDATLRPVQRIGVAEGLPNGVVTALLVSGERLVIGTENGLAIVEDGRLKAYGTREGLTDGRVSALAEDQERGIWIGTPEGGVMRLQDSGSAIFDVQDGIGRVSRFFAGADGNVCGIAPGWVVSCFDGVRFSHAAPRFAARFAPSAWRGHFGVLRDHEGGLWFATGEGLARFAPLSRLEDLSKAEPVSFYTTRDGLAADVVSQLLEDRNGDVWIGSFTPIHEPVTLWHRATGRFERFGEAAGLPAFGSPNVLGLDAAGDVWISYRDGTLARYKDGRFRILSGLDGFPNAYVTSFSSDGSGRLWATAHSVGLLRIDDPSAAKPTAILYGAREGVTGYYFGSLVIDASGGIVFGTGRELVRLDPATGRIGKVLPDRVLVQAESTSAFRDRSGALWFATWRGTTRIVEIRERETSLPRIRISGVDVSGSKWPLPGSGSVALDLGEIAPAANVSIEFFGLGAMDEPLSFTHVLEGEGESWSAPQEEHSVHFARFAPGRYRFRVRAAGSPDNPVREAVVAFRVAAPLWRRWWFVTGVAALLAGGGYAASALQTRQRRELESVRTRIASDLHDDLGAGLSRISILSEVATLALRAGMPPDEAVAQIKEASREIDERLAEGIWTVDPSHDDLSSLGRRLCLVAAELLEPAGISWKVEMPENAEDVRLRPDRRREIYLVLKEAIANAARHSAARHVVLGVARSPRRLVFHVADDGRGFTGDPGPPERLVGGRGMRNMRSRAESLGGTLRVETAPGRGTVVTLEVAEPEDA
jgi:signal transduction histidine kinase/ligand-binding sensor domain-containing protein